LLQSRYGPAEVLNTGVFGYTAYNELQFYLTKGRAFEPDIVVVAFCMNDVVNPRIHWGVYTDNQLIDIPDRAIPNLEHDRDIAIPKAGGARSNQVETPEEEESLLARSALYKAVKIRLPRIFGDEDPHAANAAASMKSKPPSKAKTITPRRNVPTYLSGEQASTIEVLLDRSSPEWQRLASIYDELHDAVKADNAVLMIAVFPLAYQMDPGYPYFPQEQFKMYCEEKHIICVDFLPVFKKYPMGDIFFLQRPRYYDVWHLKDFGHQVTAEELLRQLEEVIPFASPIF
jgi:hypothetical protein